MGSFNLSCGITGVNFNEGEEAIGYFIVENSAPTSTQPALYYNTFLDATPIECEYADYGLFNFTDKIASKRVLDFLNETAIEMNLGENKYHQQEVRNGMITEENVFDLISDDRIYVPNRFGNAFQKMHQKPNFVDESFNIKNAYKVSFVAFRKTAYENVINSKAAQTFKNDLIERAIKYDVHDQDDFFERLMAEKEGRELPPKDGEDYFYASTKRGEHFMSYSLNPLTKEDKIEWNKTYLLKTFFDNIRKPIVPSFYAGQHSVDETVEWFDLYQVVQQVEIDNEISYYEEEDEEE